MIVLLWMAARRAVARLLGWARPAPVLAERVVTRCARDPRADISAAVQRDRAEWGN